MKVKGLKNFVNRPGPLNFPELTHIILQLSDFLNIKPPQCFISRGKNWHNVKNREHPFIFIGSEHLNPEMSAIFQNMKLVFFIATQLEHYQIRPCCGYRYPIYGKLSVRLI